MNDIERRLCWYEVRDALYMKDCEDWPEALPFISVAWLRRTPEDGNEQARKKYKDFRSLLKVEIEAGRLLERGDPIELKKTIIKREFQGFSARRGGAEVWNNVERPESVRLQTVRADDLARLLRGVDLGKYLYAWLAPYYQEAEIHQEKGEPASPTPMKRAAIINDLSRRYPSIESDFNRPADWVQDCSTGKRGEYYLEKVKKACFEKWGEGNAPAALVATIRTHKIGG